MDDGEVHDEGKLNEEVIMQTLFREGMEEGAKDDFKGSKREQEIFMEVFYGTKVDDATNDHAASVCTHFHSDDGLQSKSFVDFNWESLELVNPTSVKDPISEVRPNHCYNREFRKPKHFLESSGSWAGSEEVIGSAKKMKLSSSDKVHCDSRDCTKIDVSDVDQSMIGLNTYFQDPFHFEQKTPCPTLEACDQDMFSAHDIPKRHEESNENGNITGDVSINNQSESYCSKDGNLLFEVKSVLSPVSQESFACGLQSAGAIANTSDISKMEVDYGVQCSRILDIDFSDIAAKRDFVKDLPNHLSCQASCLLIDAGWKIQRRVRNNRARLASNFIPPKGKPMLSSLSKAWKQCGLELHGDILESEVDESGRIWNSIDSFWDDLIEVLIYIEKKSGLVENSISLLHRWKLLDPFIAVIYIDRKISLLRDRAVLKAVNSSAVVLSGPSEGKLKKVPDPQSKNSKSAKRKVCSCAGQHKKLLKNLASSEEQDIHSHKCTCHLSYEVSDRNVQTKDSSGISNHVLGDSLSTYLESFPVSELSCAQSLAPSLETQPTNGSSFVKLALVESSSPVQESELSSEPNLEFLVSTEEFIGIEDLQYEENVLTKPTNSYSKKPRKKSKKISEIGTVSVASVYEDGNKESSIDFIDGKNDEASCILEESLEGCKLSSQCSKENVSASLEVEVSSLIKVEKSGKSGDRATKQQLKDNKGNGTMPLRYKEINSSSGTNKYQADQLYFEKNKCDLQGPSLCASPDHEDNKKIATSKKFALSKKSGYKRPRGFRINDDDLLIAAIIKNKDYNSCGKTSSKVTSSKPKTLRNLESLKEGPKLLLRNPAKGGQNSKEGKGIAVGARSVLCWLIQMGTVTLKDILQYRNIKTKELIKEGWVTRNGILCQCCSILFSVSDFKAHSGSKTQKSSSNLFLQSGKSYTLSHLLAWSTEYKARKCHMKTTEVDEMDQNDDTCGFCGDGGELICCDNCPSTYHQTCLHIQDLPEGSWYCHRCICQSCNNVAKINEASCSLSVVQCAQCENKYHNSCINENNLSYGEPGSATWFCGRDCQEIFFGLRSCVGDLKCLDDVYSWAILRCNHDDQIVQSVQKIARAAECNIKLAIALTIMEECFQPMIDPRTGINMIPHALYNFRSAFARLNYQGFYTVVLEKGDELISVASIRLHGTTVAEMPLIATCSNHRRQGMCKRLMHATEKMLESFKIKRLVLSAIPSTVETWMSGFGFRPIEDCERTQLNQINLMLLPGTVMLIKCFDICSDTTSGEEVNNTCDVRANEFNLFNGFVEKDGLQTSQLTCDTEKSNPDAESALPVTATFPAKEENHVQLGVFSVSPSEAPNFVSRHDDHSISNNIESLCATDIYVTGLLPQDNFSPSVTRETTGSHTLSSSLTVLSPDRHLHVTTCFSRSNNEHGT